ncbi:unnamed protein product [Vicia faba]|uniref:Uncharacterized protein n=1 Tax=Vicia faba TaxID=3906 RepID=A0AAV1ADM7_VICFA|nr:unnamed protein product [Vicia faba]
MLTEIPTCFAGIESLFAILALDHRKTAIELALSKGDSTAIDKLGSSPIVLTKKRLYSSLYRSLSGNKGWVNTGVSGAAGGTSGASMTGAGALLPTVGGDGGPSTPTPSHGAITIK